MSLNFKEKRALQKTVTEQQAALRGGSLGFKEKRGAQKLLRDALAKLGAATKPSEPPMPANESPFAPLLAGDFNRLPVPEFVTRLEGAYSEEEDLEKAKQAAIQYLEANRETLEAA